ncbi:SagB/ThcOx family dehydrogenase [Candidatus Pacearchaeota archaeon]|nr:SagB/ThcOx family dehydrogenase [Candidatus Pacearchaeota archaeon]
MLKEIREFYERTKFDFSKNFNPPSEEETPFNWVKIFFKRYPRMPIVELMPEAKDGEYKRILFQRESKRDYEDRGVPFKKISNVLYYSAGIHNPSAPPDNTRRFYPSGGARFPIELYYISNNTENLDAGLYHYDVKGNKLEYLLRKDLREESSQLFGREVNANHPNYIILTSVVNRSEVKYGFNAYRFSLIECGHIGQNIYLSSQQEGLGCCALGGFDNDGITKLLDITKEEIPLYAFSLGLTSR